MVLSEGGEMKKYTVDEIKKAFWETFHESGELWFCYISTPENNTEHTESYWENFLENLEDT